MGYYVVSGKVDIKRLLIFFPIALIVAFLIAYLYALATYYLPGFLVIVFVLIYSLLISGTGYIMIQKSKIRKGVIRISTFSLLVIIALFATWCFYLANHFDVSVFKVATDLFYYLNRFANDFKFIYSFGYLLWLTEAVVLIFIPIGLAYKTALKDVLFCEKCDRPIMNKLKRHLAYSKEYTREDLERMIDDKKHLDFIDLKRTTKDDPNQYEINFAFCGGCDEPVYIQVLKHVMPTKGSSTRKKTDLILPFFALDSSIQWKDLVKWPTRPTSPFEIDTRLDDLDEVDEAF